MEAGNPLAQQAKEHLVILLIPSHQAKNLLLVNHQNHQVLPQAVVPQVPQVLLAAPPLAHPVPHQAVLLAAPLAALQVHLPAAVQAPVAHLVVHPLAVAPVAHLHLTHKVN